MHTITNDIQLLHFRIVEVYKESCCLYSCWAVDIYLLLHYLQFLTNDINSCHRVNLINFNFEVNHIHLFIYFFFSDVNTVGLPTITEENETNTIGVHLMNGHVGKLKKKKEIHEKLKSFSFEINGM